MKVNELKPKQGNVDIELDVMDIGQVREFEKFGKSGRVATAMAKDDTGDVKVSLWNEDIEKVKAGDKIKITNGWVSEWQGELQLSAGKLGKLEVIGAASNESAPAPEKPKEEQVAPEEDVKDPDEEAI